MEQKQNKPLATKKERCRWHEIEELLPQYSLSSEEGKKLSSEMEHLRNDYNWFDVIFEENGKEGIKDVFGNILVPAMYEHFRQRYSYLYREHENIVYPARLNGKEGLVKADGTGTPITEFKYHIIVRNTGYRGFLVDYDKKAGMIDKDGKVIIPFEMDDLDSEMVNGIQIFEKRIDRRRKYGFITYYGDYIEPKFDEVVADIDCPLVRVGEEWGYVRADNHEFISKQDYEDSEDVDIIIIEC